MDDMKAASEANPEQTSDKGLEPDQVSEVETKPEFEITVSADGMTAYIRVQGGVFQDTVIEEHDVIEQLSKSGVIYGVDHDAVREFCAAKTSVERRKVAFGLRPVDGKNGRVELNFETTSGVPRELEDGRVDYRDLNLIKNVKKGDLLCTIIPPEPGEDGIDVEDNSVMAKPGSKARITAGKNVRFCEDDTEVRAETDGCVYYTNNTIFVEDIYRVSGDVNLKTGHVNFNGSVTISGSVTEGFNVTAQNDIYVGGRVEGAQLTAGGNIVIAAGISGMNRAVISAGGDVTAKFIESAEVVCGGNVYCDNILKSTVKAEKSILMKGRKATIIGGKALAGERIVAKTIGSDLNLNQEVTVRKNWKLFENTDLQREQIESKKDLKAKLSTAEQYLMFYVNKLNTEKDRGEEKDMKALRDYMVKKAQAAAVVSSLKTLLSQMQEDEDSNSNIVCTGIVYPGVKIMLDGCRYTVTMPLQNQKFYVSDGDVVLGAVLPGEGIV